MRKLIILASAFTITAVLCTAWIATAYRRDAKVEIFIRDFDALTDEVVKKINGDPTLAGVVAARQILDARKPGLREELTEWKGADASQVSGRMMLRIQESVEGNVAKLNGLLENPAVRRAVRDDPKFRGQMTRLLAEHKSIIQ